MYKLLIKLIFVQFFIISSLGQNNQNENQAPSQSGLYIAYYNSCEGSEAANYTVLGEFTLSQDCSRLNDGGTNQLIQTSPGNQKSVISLQQLARSDYPAGAFSQVETLWLATGGPLMGRYIYEKVIYLSAAYLKKCSSILGYAYVSSKSALLMINQKLDLNVFINPSGAFEAFSRGCTTTCKGKAYLF